MSGQHRAPRQARHSRSLAAVASWLVLGSGLITGAVALDRTGLTGALKATAISANQEADVVVATPGTVASPPVLVVGEPDVLEPPMTRVVADEPVDSPARLVVADIEVESAIQPLGLNDDGSLEVPAKGPLYDQAGWYTGSPRPGEAGPAVVLGHVTGNGGLPSVFYRLHELRAGHLVTIDRADGTHARFEVYRVDQYPKDEFPTAAVYGDTREPELRLITCAGVWDAVVGSHRDNTVVYARFISDT